MNILGFLCEWLNSYEKVEKKFFFLLFKKLTYFYEMKNMKIF